MPQFETYKSLDTHKLFLQSWRPAKAKASIWFTHGYGEHSDWHRETCEKLCQQGFEVWAWDLPGHGRSSGKRGHLGSYEKVSHLMSSLISEFIPLDRSCFLIGHSMGGLLTFFHLEQGNIPKNLNGVILSAPAFKPLNALLPPKAHWILNFLSQTLPKCTIPSYIPSKHICSDPEVITQLERDPYIHRSISLSTLYSMISTGPLILKGTKKNSTPVLALLSEKDKVVSSAMAKKVLKKRCSKLKIKSYNGQHDILHDIRKEEAMKDIFIFLKAHT